MSAKYLVTGGHGFIGRRLVEQLAIGDAAVIVLDNWLPQVHGPDPQPFASAANVRSVRGDVRDPGLLKELAGEGFDVVFHLASLTGVGQSMYQIEEYTDVNCRGTAALLEALAGSPHPPRKLVLSSSRAVYGEGRQRCPACGLEFYPPTRSEGRLAQHRWEHACPRCGSDSGPLPSVETAPAQPTSVYALTKLAQEHLVATVGAAYNIPAVVLRYFNVYGPGQSPLNPYTGILSIFVRRLMNGQGIEVYEDGQELRDFVHVDDVVQATLLAGRADVSGTFNVCSGEATSVYQVAALLAEIVGLTERVLTINGKYRVGDIRHGVGAWESAGQALGYRPQVTLRHGLEQLVAWMAPLADAPRRLYQQMGAGADPDEVAREELQARGLLR